MVLQFRIILSCIWSKYRFKVDIDLLSFAAQLYNFLFPVVKYLKLSKFCGSIQRRRGAICSGTSEPNLSPTKWLGSQRLAIKLFIFEK